FRKPSRTRRSDDQSPSKAIPSTIQRRFHRLKAPGRMQKILVIDDEEWLREMVHLALSQKGYEVIEAGNGVTGVQVALKELPDLILCDVNMEKMDGYRTLSSMRAEQATASIPFILMTGLVDNAGMRPGMA